MNSIPATIASLALPTSASYYLRLARSHSRRHRAIAPSRLPGTGTRYSKYPGPRARPPLRFGPGTRVPGCVNCATIEWFLLLLQYSTVLYRYLNFGSRRYSAWYSTTPRSGTKNAQRCITGRSLERDETRLLVSRPRRDGCVQTPSHWTIGD